jgi:hypothetical protein
MPGRSLRTLAALHPGLPVHQGNIQVLVGDGKIVVVGGDPELVRLGPALARSHAGAQVVREGLHQVLVEVRLGLLHQQHRRCCQYLTGQHHHHLLLPRAQVLQRDLPLARGLEHQPVLAEGLVLGGS